MAENNSSTLVIRQLQAWQEISVLLNPTLNIREVLEPTLESAESLVGFNMGIIYQSHILRLAERFWSAVLILSFLDDHGLHEGAGQLFGGGLNACISL